MLVLQTCSDSLHILPGSSSQTNATSGCVCNFSNTEFDEDINVIEESFVSINENVERGIKQEEIPGDISFPDIKSEPDKVSYVCICGLLLEVFLSFSTNLGIFFDVSIPDQLKKLHYWEEKYFCWCAGGRVGPVWVGQHVIA